MENTTLSLSSQIVLHSKNGYFRVPVIGIYLDEYRKKAKYQYASLYRTMTVKCNHKHTFTVALVPETDRENGKRLWEHFGDRRYIDYILGH